MWESKSNLELFYQLFIKFFGHIFLALVLDTCLNGVWNYCYIYWSDLTPLKRWSSFPFLLRVACVICVRAINTDIWQAIIACATSLQKTVVSRLKMTSLNNVKRVSAKLLEIKSPWSVRLLQVLCNKITYYWCLSSLNRGVCQIQVYFTVKY